MYINYKSAQNGWTEKDIRSLRVHSHRGQLFRNVLEPEFVLAKYASGGKVDLPLDQIWIIALFASRPGEVKN